MQARTLTRCSCKSIAGNLMDYLLYHYVSYYMENCSGAHHIILKGQNPVSSLSSHPTAKPHCKTLRHCSAIPQHNSAVVILTNPTSIASHITVSSYTAALSQCHFRSIIQSIPHTLQHQEISTFRSVTHALVVSQQTHAVMFRLLLVDTGRGCREIDSSKRGRV